MMRLGIANFIIILFGIYGFFLLEPLPVAAEEFKPITASSKEIAFARSLKERETIVIKQEEELEKKLQEFTALQEDVETKLDRLTRLEQDVQKKIDELIGIKDKEFKNLIKVYSTMSPSKVAPLLNKMEDGTVVKILRAMKSDVVAKIIPKLDQSKAVRISKDLGLLD